MGKQAGIPVIGVVDVMNWGDYHLSFNGTMILALVRAIEDGKIVVLVRESYKARLEEVLSTTEMGQVVAERVQWELISDDPGMLEKFGALVSLLWEWSPRRMFGLAVGNGLDLLTGYMLSFLQSETVGYVILHNNVSGMHGGLLGPAKRMFARLVFRRRQLIPVVLTQKQKQALEAMDIVDSVYIPHPNYKHWFANDLRVQECQRPEDVAYILIIGRHAETLDGALVNMLTQAARVASKESGRPWRLRVSGVREELEMEEGPYFESLEWPLERRRYVEEMCRATAVLILGVNDVVRPSGVLMDAVSAGTLVIAPSEGHLSDYAKPEGGYRIGAFGYDRVSEIPGIIRRVATIGPEQRAELRRRTHSGAQCTSLERTADRLATLLKDRNG